MYEGTVDPTAKSDFVRRYDDVVTPTLATARLTLRPFEIANAADVFAYASNPNVARHTTWRTHETIADADAFVAMVLARPATEPTWAIRLTGAPTVIGAIEFGPTDARVAAVHYVLAEPFWNRGLMTEAVRAVLAWGWANCPSVQRVETYATLANVGSQRVIMKSGMTRVGTTMHAWAKSPTPVEQAKFAIDRDHARG